MTDKSTPWRVVLDGASHLGLAVSLSASGCVVHVLESDPHDRARAADYLTQVAAKVALTGNAAVLATADLVLTLRERSPANGSVLSLGWQSGKCAAHVSETPGGRRLVELIGADAKGQGQRLAQALQATLVLLPLGSVPPSLRLLAALSSEIEALMLTGPTPEDIDTALENAGVCRGPFEVQDATGVDTALAQRRVIQARYSGSDELPLFARAVAEGRLGRKVGVGWYRYPGGGGKVEDPLIEDMAAEEAHFSGWSRREVSAEEISQRAKQALFGAREAILAERVVSEAELCLIQQLVLGSPP